MVARGRPGRHLGGGGGWKEGGVRVNRDIYFASSPPPWLRPFSHLLRRQFQTYMLSTRANAHTYGVHIHGRQVQRQPTHRLQRHNPPVFALAWHGTASLFGHFRPGQAPPTFILITSWFAPGFCSPSFFPSERFPTANAWEPHLCPLAYSCPGLATRASTSLSLSLSLLLFFYPSSLLPPASLTADLAEIRRPMRSRRDGARLMEIFT